MAFTFEPNTTSTVNSVASTDLATLPPDVNAIYRLSDTDQVAVYDPVKQIYRLLDLGLPVNPEFVAAEIIDFRTMPDLTTLGIETNGTYSVSSNAINGQVQGVLDANDGLKLIESKSSAWNHVFVMRKIGAAIASGKSLSFICRAGADAYVMLGLFGLHREPDDCKFYQAYADFEPSIYMSRYTESSVNKQRIYRPYLGMDDNAYAVTSLAFKNAANVTATLDDMTDKWWKGEITAMGIEGCTISATEINPAAAGSTVDLFGAGVEFGEKLTAIMPVYRGNTSEYASFGFSLNRANAGMDLMAVKLA